MPNVVDVGALRDVAGVAQELSTSTGDALDFLDSHLTRHALAAQAIARGARPAQIARQEELTGWATEHTDDEESRG